MRLVSTVRKNFTVTELWVAIAIFAYLTSVGSFVLTRPAHFVAASRSALAMQAPSVSSSLMGIKNPS